MKPTMVQLQSQIDPGQTDSERKGIRRVYRDREKVSLLEGCNTFYHQTGSTPCGRYGAY
jgi:hypothetical protein